jgi:hypothetical protein
LDGTALTVLGTTTLCSDLKLSRTMLPRITSAFTPDLNADQFYPRTHAGGWGESQDWG